MTMATIGLGGNLASWAGPPPSTLAAAALRLQSLGRLLCRSSLYSTEPVGLAQQPRFVNAVVALETNLAPRELLHRLLAIEQEFGRDRTAGVANGPRTLDLDILLLDDLKIDEPGLQIPHPRLAERAFVLVPLNEIASQIFATSQAETVSQWLHILNLSSKNDAHAVVRIHSDGWCVGRCDDGPRAH